MAEDDYNLRDTELDKMLYKLSINTLDTRRKILTHRTPEVLIGAIKKLFKAEILFTDKNRLRLFNILLEHRQADLYADTLVMLNNLHLLPQDKRALLFNDINKVKDLGLLLELLSALLVFKLLDHSARDIVIKTFLNHPYPSRFAKSFKKLLMQNFISKENFDTLASHAELDSISGLVTVLSDANLMTKENKAKIFESILKYRQLSLILKVLKIVNQHSLLNENNLAVLFKIEDIESLESVLTALKEQGKLDNEYAATIIGLLVNTPNPKSEYASILNYLANIKEVKNQMKEVINNAPEEDKTKLINVANQIVEIFFLDNDKAKKLFKDNFAKREFNLYDAADPTTFLLFILLLLGIGLFLNL